MVEVNWTIPAWGVIVGILGFIGSVIKIYYNFIWLEKKFNFWQEDYILFKTQTQDDIEKAEADIKEQSNLKGVDIKKLSNAVEELIKSNIQTQELLKYLNKDVEAIKEKLK